MSVGIRGRSRTSCCSSRVLGDMHAKFVIDDGHQFFLSDVINFVLAIVSTLLLLSGGERRRWEVEADLLAWKNRRIRIVSK